MDTGLRREYWWQRYHGKASLRVPWVVEQEVDANGKLIRDRDVNKTQTGRWYNEGQDGFDYVNRYKQEDWIRIPKCKVKKLLGITEWKTD